MKEGPSRARGAFFVSGGKVEAVLGAEGERFVQHLAGADQQAARGREMAAQRGDHLGARGGIEVDEHVAAENQVEGPRRSEDSIRFALRNSTIERHFSAMAPSTKYCERSSAVRPRAISAGL